MRRFTRLTNAFSKKVENHAHSVALHYMFYNFCRIHQTLKVTPAMESGLADHDWSIEELCFDSAETDRQSFHDWQRDGTQGARRELRRILFRL